MSKHIAMLTLLFCAATNFGFAQTNSIIQAESGTLLGSAKFYDDPAAANGKGVAYISSIDAGFKLESTPKANSVTIKYASELSGKLSFFVNGNDMGDINFTGNGTWVGNYVTESINVNIPQGATFEIKFQDSDAAMNIDQLTFTSEETPTETCSDGILNNGEIMIDCGGSNCIPCSPPADKNPVIANANNPQKGIILVGGEDAEKEGFSLYTFDNDNDNLPFSDCYTNCESNWPPVIVDKPEDLIIANQVSANFTKAFGLSARCDGKLQVTYDKKPLYYYALDNNAGEVKGDGSNGVWHLAIKENSVQPTCNDGLLNNGELEIDCGGPNCSPCGNLIIDKGTCGDYGLTITESGQGILFYKEALGNVSYMCTGPDFNGCAAPSRLANGYYQRDINVTIGTNYEFAIQGASNITFKVKAGDNRCYFVPTCTDGVKNAGETGVDCGGPLCDVCPTCDDNIQNGDEEGVDCGGSNCSIKCDEVCNGTPNPNAKVSKTNETLDGKNDGTVKFTFDNVTGRDDLEFSLDNGATYPFSSLDNAGSLIIKNQKPGTYKAWVRWGNNDCPIDLGQISIAEGGPAPSCSDGIRNQGEERVDCGGPNCSPCTGSPCGDIPLVDYERKGLPTPIVGIKARNSGFAFDLSEDLKKISVTYGTAIGVQSGGNPEFEFSCSCNQVEFQTVKVGDGATVPQACQDAGNFFYFFRYKKIGYMTDDPGDQYVYSALFNTEEPRINPDTRPTISSSGANWMRFRHPHAYDGITEAIFDAVGNGDQLRHLDRYVTEFRDGPDQFIIDPKITNGGSGTSHPHTGPAASVIRIDAMDKGTSPATEYALQRNKDMGGDFNYGQCVNFEITAVAGGSGAQTYNTLQHYFMGVGLDSYGDPRLASAGRASTIMTLPSQKTANYTDITRADQFTQAQQTLHYELERDAIFTQHLITLTDENDVDDFLEGHHIFHGVINRADAPEYRQYAIQLGEKKIGSKACADCHFRDGRGPEVIQTKNGPRVPPAVFGTGILQYIVGAEAKLTWTGNVATVEQQVKNALINDHGILNPDSDIPAKDLKQLIAYTEFLTVPSRSPAAYDTPGVASGEKSFNSIGCVNCHSPTQKTSSSAPEEFRNLIIRPYTDMKLHKVTGQSFRTPPLWGLGRNIKLLKDNSLPLLLMHDGRAKTLDGAIQAHGGEASASRSAYEKLSATEKANLIKFLETL